MTRGQKSLGLALLGVIATLLCLFVFAGVYVLGETATGRVVDHHIHQPNTADWTCAPVVEYGG